MKAVVCDLCGLVFAQQGDADGAVRSTEWGYILTYAEMDHDVRPENSECVHLHEACVVPWLAAADPPAKEE